MLLAVDVGNTNTVVGVFDGERLAAHWRLETREARTADEYAQVLHGFFQLSSLKWGSIDAAILATVVPAVRFAVEKMCETHLGLQPLVVGPGVKSGMPILYENPREVGADRIVNAVAAFEQFKQGWRVRRLMCIATRSSNRGPLLDPALDLHRASTPPAATVT